MALISIYILAVFIFLQSNCDAANSYVAQTMHDSNNFHLAQLKPGLPVLVAAAAAFSCVAHSNTDTADSTSWSE